MRKAKFTSCDLDIMDVKVYLEFYLEVRKQMSQMS